MRIIGILTLLVVSCYGQSYSTFAAGYTGAGGASTIASNAVNVVQHDTLHIAAWTANNNCIAMSVSGWSLTSGDTPVALSSTTGQNSGQCMRDYYVADVASASASFTVSVTFNANYTYAGIYVHVLHGTDNTGPDGVGCGVSPLFTTTTTTCNITTTNANDIISALLLSPAFQTIAPNPTAGTTGTCASGGGTCTATAIGQYKVVTATQTGAAVPITFASSNGAVMRVIAFKQGTATRKKNGVVM